MHRSDTGPRRHNDSSRGDRGQIIVIAALAMVALIGGVSLVIEGGNAYAHQRIAQNGIDAVANAGATVIAQKIGGATRTDGDVSGAASMLATANGLSAYAGYYTDLTGGMLTTLGTTTSNVANAAAVGGGTIPPNTQGVRMSGSQTFGTTFARVLGLNQFTASADATAVAGALTGGVFMPIVFPVTMKNCDGTGALSAVDAPWRMSNPGSPHPVGQEYIVPLCKTGGGSFMILDLDPDKNCYEEVTNPSSIQFNNFPVDVHTDTGNDCAKKIEDAVTASNLHGQVVLIPICDGECSTDSGNNGTYHIVRIAAFYLDYISYSNSPSNSACKLTTSPSYGTSLANAVGGNGSSSCVAGWFVRYITSGPVGAGTIGNGEAIGVQLIR
ncbi:MAG: Tad domain-containing protein [Candidatus Limnocylindrales bacterium]